MAYCFLRYILQFCFFSRGAWTDRRVTLVHYADESVAQYLKDYPPNNAYPLPMGPQEAFERPSDKRSNLVKNSRFRAWLEVMSIVAIGGTAIVGILRVLICFEFNPSAFWPALKAVFSACHHLMSLSKAAIKKANAKRIKINQPTKERANGVVDQT